MACVRAIFSVHAGNKRFAVSAGVMPAGSSIADFLVACFPQLRDRVRRDSIHEQALSEHLYHSVLDTSLARDILGIQQYRSVEITLTDTACQILDLQRRKEWLTIVQS